MIDESILGIYERIADLMMLSTLEDKLELSDHEGIPQTEYLSYMQEVGIRV